MKWNWNKTAGTFHGYFRIFVLVFYFHCETAEMKRRFISVLFQFRGHYNTRGTQPSSTNRAYTCSNAKRGRSVSNRSVLLRRSDWITVATHVAGARSRRGKMMLLNRKWFCDTSNEQRNGCRVRRPTRSHSASHAEDYAHWRCVCVCVCVETET